MERNVEEPDFDFVSTKQAILDIWGGATLIYALCVAFFWLIGAVTGAYSITDIFFGSLIEPIVNWVLVAGAYAALLTLLYGLYFTGPK